MGGKRLKGKQTLTGGSAAPLTSGACPDRLRGAPLGASPCFNFAVPGPFLVTKCPTVGPPSSVPGAEGPQKV